MVCAGCLRSSRRGGGSATSAGVINGRLGVMASGEMTGSGNRPVHTELRDARARKKESGIARLKVFVFWKGKAAAHRQPC
jgi:hypothetical protein